MGNVENRGGKREGAGRPPKGRIAMTIRVPADIAVEVRRRAKAQNKSLGEVISEAIRECN